MAFTHSEQAFAQTKSLKLYYTHTKERVEITFKRNGRYDQAGLKKLNRLLRDWRLNESIKMDPRLFDLIWEVYRQSGASNYIHIVSAYRSPKTNEMLRKAGGGQAKHSQHTTGKAIDFYIPGVKTSKLRAIAMKLQGGGVGYYPKSASPFVHLDVGNIRAWPRMSRTELVKLFPHGKTLHLPHDGKPLSGYKVALREYKNNERANETRATKPLRQKTGVPKQTPIFVAKATTDHSQNSENSHALPKNLFSLNNKNNVDPRESKTGEKMPVPQIRDTKIVQYVKNLTPLPRDNIPMPSSLNIAGVKPQIVNEREPTREAEPIQIAVLNHESHDNHAIGGDSQTLSYYENKNLVPLPRFAEIITSAIKTDKQQRQNGEIPGPERVELLSQQGQASIDIASLQTPYLREHNKLSRADFMIKSSKLRAGSDKVERPNLRDGLATQYKSVSLTPSLKQMIISRRIFSPESIQTMQPPARAPRFVNRFMRKVPEMIYANGFSKKNIVQQKQIRFEGNAVNFLPVVKYTKSSL